MTQRSAQGPRNRGREIHGSDATLGNSALSLRTKSNWSGNSDAHIFAPVVLPAPEYGLPEWLELQIKRERFALGAGDSSVSEAEVVAYLMNASLMSPLLEQYARLYLHLGKRYLGLVSGEPVPDVLGDDETEALGEIKRIILRERAACKSRD